MHIHVRRYPMSAIPTGDQAIADWLMNLYVEKDALLQHFKDTGRFPGVKPAQKGVLPQSHTYNTFIPESITQTGDWLMNLYVDVEKDALLQPRPSVSQTTQYP